MQKQVHLGQEIWHGLGFIAEGAVLLQGAPLLHTPTGEHWQPVEVAVEPLVLAHKVPSRFNDTGQGLGSGDGLS
jgi:hypothetical protein